jgi:tRNA U34 2-thiouridine synthase MnmA/TrmU
MTNNIAEKLKAALIISEQMLKAAEAKQWDEISLLQVKRQQLFEAIFPLDNEQNTELNRQAIEKLLTMNEQLEKLCHAQKDALKNEMSHHNSNKKAVAAYRSV